VLELILENGLKQDSIKQELVAAKANKDKLAIKAAITVQTIINTTLDASLVKLLVPEQAIIYKKHQIEQGLKGRLKKNQVK